MNVVKGKNVNQIPSWRCKLEEIKSIYIEFMIYHDKNKNCIIIISLLLQYFCIVHTKFCMLESKFISFAECDNKLIIIPKSRQTTKDWKKIYTKKRFC